ncbi:MAG: hypothetical protein JWM59_428 [Verrucomicrobiales bacterium]|nr:hypothetical protein [Verrucomicrobiales bacterium]
MAAYPTPDIVTALAPDASSLKAGRGLASPGKWTLAAGNDTALWGLMQGSGKDPYHVRVLADGSATKCSCPSRKFPCKHALGLLLIAAEQPAKLAASAPPDWLEEWLASRAEKTVKTETKAAKAAEGGPKAPADGKAQAQRRAKRMERMAEGMGFLNQWLGDFVRQGLAEAPVTDHSFWENTARRMVDAQAPGLARRLRQAQETALSDAMTLDDARKNAPRLPDDLGRLHLLLTAGTRLETLDPDLRAEVEQLLGWTVAQESVLSGPGVTDRWFAAARTVQEEERVITAVTWLYGAESGRHAMWIQSAPAQQPVFTPLPIGRWLKGELAFYPGVQPLRALWKTPFSTTQAPPGGVPFETVCQVLERYAHGLEVNPWRTVIPFYLHARPMREKQGKKEWLVDGDGQALPVVPNDARRQLMGAISGGRPGLVFGLWNGYEVTPLGIESETGWVSLT